MTPKAIIEELFRRRLAGDDTAVDELVAEDMINPAPPSCLNVPIGPRRTLATQSFVAAQRLLPPCIAVARLNGVRESLGFDPCQSMSRLPRIRCLFLCN